MGRLEVARDLHLVPGLGTANACLLVRPRVVLFDSGLPGDGPHVLQYLREVGLSPADLELIALTHGDAGHAGAAPWLRRNSGARIAASAETALRLSQPSPPGMLQFGWRLALGAIGRRSEAFAVDEVLEPGQEIAGFQIIATPGHAEGHLAFFRPADGVLIAGDAVRVSGLDLLAPAFWDADSELQARVSVCQLADLPVHLLVAGHGPPYREPGAALRRVGGPPGLLEERLRRRRAARRRWF